MIADPNQEAAGQSAFFPEGGEHIACFPVINLRIRVKISVGTALTPDHAAVTDVNMMVLKPDQTLPGAGCGIGIKGRAGSPFRNGGASLGSRYTDNGNPGLLITGIHKSGNQRAGFHTRLVNSGEKILVLSEWLRDGMKRGWI